MDNSAAGNGSPKPSPFETILETVRKVIMAPADFYRAMPKGGGFGDPLVFVVVLGVVSGVVQAVLSLVHLGAAGSVMMALGLIILSPVWIVVGSFIGAAILFVIWKLMGSNESYEVAYRCGAYTAAIAPITALLGIIPYVGSLAGLAWGLYLIVLASVEVHKLPAKKAWLVFGIIAAVLAMMSLSAQAGARKVQKGMTGWQQSMQGKSGRQMTADDAAAFAKAMQEQARIEMEKAKAEAKEE